MPLPDSPVAVDAPWRFGLGSTAASACTTNCESAPRPLRADVVSRKGAIEADVVAEGVLVRRGGQNPKVTAITAISHRTGAIKALTALIRDGDPLYRPGEFLLGYTLLSEGDAAGAAAVFSRLVKRVDDEAFQRIRMLAEGWLKERPTWMRRTIGSRIHFVKPSPSPNSKAREHWSRGLAHKISPLSAPCRIAMRTVPLTVARVTVANLLKTARWCSAPSGTASLMVRNSSSPSRSRKKSRYSMMKSLMM